MKSSLVLCRTAWASLFAGSSLTLQSAEVPAPAPTTAGGPGITIRSVAPPPEWALWQRHLLDQMWPATEEFVAKYTRPDGSLIWREEWPGMDGSDDGYESFYNFPLYYALGGPDPLLPLARRLWDAVTRQFTAYGQVHKEFDGYYDWMHHGESYVNFYFFGLADPGLAEIRTRSRRFAGFYLNEDPEAPNYDPVHRLIRSPLTGSRGPRFVTTAEDWSTHRDDLAPYPLPFEDIPGITSGRDWLDDAKLPAILDALNQRMMRGDVPLNLTATSLLTDAFLHTGDDRYRRWVIEYVEAWMERVRQNGGILPDNVGPTGQIGECMGGKWWGGYYGWRWPHGLFNLVESTLIAAANAHLLTGDSKYFELPRSVLRVVEGQAKTEAGRVLVPHRHGDQGWYDYRPINPSYLIHLYSCTEDPEDYARIGRLANPSAWNRLNYRKAKGDFGHEGPWLRFVQGDYPEYPQEILRATYAETLRRLEVIRTDTTEPAERDVHHWQQRNPVVLEALVQTLLGAPNHIYHGGLLHGRVWYFDPERTRSGLPPDVAALVERIEPPVLSVHLVNLHSTQARDVLLQAGAFGEHQFLTAEFAGQELRVNHHRLAVRLPPGASGRINLRLQRYVNPPRYHSAP
ncbi:MAG: hypothetical protein HS113_08215 [Verrucomicrobiales bacterium]|nr:hypothetical protein [Verrucomicrobiales bacterium]